MLAVALPLLGTYLRRQRLPQCALDGVAVVPTYAVEIATAGEPTRRFCCIRCAQYWLQMEKTSPASRSVNVTDEVTARPVDARDAFFVRSRVVTNAVTGNNVHAFAERADAEQHAAQFRGKLLTKNEHPFDETVR